MYEPILHFSNTTLKKANYNLFNSLFTLNFSKKSKVLSLICIKVVKHFSCFSPPQKCKKQVAAWSTNIIHHIQQEIFLLMEYCCKPITSSFYSKKNISVQRWNSIPVELILQSDSGILCGLLCYQSLSLVLIRLDQKLLLHFDRSFGSFLRFLQLWKRKKIHRHLSVSE